MFSYIVLQLEQDADQVLPFFCTIFCTTRVLHTALRAGLRAVLTKSADEWTGKFEG